MLSVFERYLTRELFLTFLAVTFVLFMVMAGNTFSFMMQLAANGRLAAEDLLWLITLESVFILVSVLPVGAFFAVVVSLGRWYRDSEMVAAQSVGLGFFSFNRALFKFMLPVALFSGILTLYVLPISEQTRGVVEAESKQKAQSKLVSEGEFIPLQNGRGVIYAQGYNDAGQMQDVFVKSTDDGNRSIETAATAQITQVGDDRVMRLEHGHVVTHSPKANISQTQISYAAHDVYLEYGQRATEGTKKWRVMSNLALWQHGNAKAQAELHWRLSMPISIMILLVIALPLSHMRPRQGRFSRMGIALLVFVVYSNLILVLRREIENGLPWISMYGVHALMLLFGVYLLYRRGVFIQTRQREVRI